MVGAVEQGRLKLYDAATLQQIGEPNLGLSNIWSFGFSPDTRLLIAGDIKGHLGVWDIPGKRMVTNFTAHLGGVALSKASFMPGGNRLLTYGTDGITREWDLATWTETRRWQLDPQQADSIAISPSASLAATSTRDGLFELINIKEPARRRRFSGQNRTVAIDLSRDGKTFAAASENGTVELWDTETVTRTALMHGVVLGYHSVAISPDGERVVAGSNGQEAMKVWDLRSHEDVATLRGNGSFFSSAAFSSDGNTIGARNWNGVIHFWSAPSWKEVEAAEKARSTRLP
jgi:WD40 repeat protein